MPPRLARALTGQSSPVAAQCQTICYDHGYPATLGLQKGAALWSLYPAKPWLALSWPEPPAPRTQAVRNCQARTASFSEVDNRHIIVVLQCPTPWRRKRRKLVSVFLRLNIGYPINQTLRLYHINELYNAYQK